jgi:hypothetical protein
MNSEILFSLFKKLADDQFTLICMGEFDDELTTSLIRMNETEIGEPKILRRRLSFLIAECFQNIIWHPDKPEILNRTNNKPKMFLVRNVENNFYIASTNLIDNTKIPGLETKLKSINALTQDELKSEYIRALASTHKPADKGGTSLGLLQMALKSGNQPDFEFEFVNYFFSVFYIQLRVKWLNASNDVDSSLISINDTKALYQEMLTENVLLLRKGDFSQQSILPLIEYMEKNARVLESGSGVSRKKIIYILIELLQNMCKHAAEIDGRREGVFIMSVKDGKYVLSTGNYIDSSKVDFLKNKLKLLSGMSSDELDEAYRKNLPKKESRPEEKAGLGLIEICKYSTEKIKYSFIPVSDKVSFFISNVTI